MSKVLEQQIVDLQAKIAFQEDVIQTLSDVVSEQDKRVLNLEAKMTHWQSKFEELLNATTENINTLSSEKPPHY